MDCLPNIHVAARARLLALLFALFPSLCEASEPWEFADYALTGAALATLAVDWGQTRHIAKNPHRFYEKNQILGAKPAVGKVDAYFLGAMLGITGACSSPARCPMELSVIDQNRSIGIKVDF